MESEAELSGDDVGSDPDEEDLLEQEAEQQNDLLVQEDLLGMTDTQLRDQVNKAHM